MLASGFSPVHFGWGWQPSRLLRRSTRLGLESRRPRLIGVHDSVVARDGNCIFLAVDLPRWTGKRLDLHLVPGSHFAESMPNLGCHAVRHRSTANFCVTTVLRERICYS